ncbi:ABC transporter permease [Thermoanaerobacteraceae bacterium SP2]|nr:ABC transporter permease [Thermoanaerobacteraceae bacterium SP2]
MLAYIYRTLVHYRIQAASLLLGLFAIHMGTCMGLFSLEQTRVSVTQDIAQYSRDVYDILVKPNETGQNTIRVDDRDYMEPNYVCKNYDGDSGISIETWREIQSIPGVELAAPIAALGFFTNSIDSVQIKRPAGQSLRLGLDFFTSDGYKEYKIGESTIVSIASLPNLKVPEVAISSIDTNNGFSMRSNSERLFLYFELPHIYNFLVAIDPESEAKLVGLSDALQKGRYLSPGPVPVEKISFGAKITTNAYQIPLLINELTPIPLSVKITEEKLDLPPDLIDSIRLLRTQKTEKDLLLKKNIDERLLQLPATTKATKEIELTKYLRAFQTTGIEIDPQWIISTTSQGLQRIAPATEFYTTRGIHYKAAQDNSLIFYPEPTCTRDGQVQFHDLQAKGRSAVDLATEGKPVFQLNPIGTVSFRGPKQNELAKSPLGIYGSEEMLLESDINGNKLSEPVKLHPTITPGTVQLPAAHGFTTLEAAKIIEGDHPIDVIRVRVADVNRFDEKGQAKIRQVAEEIVARTGLHVDIIAGTSMQEVKLNIPGYKDVPPLGLAKTSWISLGAATRIQNIFSLFSMALTLLFIVVGFIFVHNRSSIYLWQRKSELDILKTQGWQGGTIAKMISLEVLIIWFIAALLSMAANVLFHEILHVEWNRLLLLWLIVTFTGGMTFAVTTHRGVSKFFKSREGSKNKPYTKSGSEYRKTEGISTVIRKDLMYYGGRLRFMAVQLVIGGTISIFA